METSIVMSYIAGTNQNADSVEHARILSEGFVECRIDGREARFSMAPRSVRGGMEVGPGKALRTWLKSAKAQ